jgi:hypothetical protein
MDFFNIDEHFVSYFSQISQFWNPGARLVSPGRNRGLGLLTHALKPSEFGEHENKKSAASVFPGA